MLTHYDGTYPGFLTVIFARYRTLETIEIEPLTPQMDFLVAHDRVATDPAKAARVARYLRAQFGADFLRRCYAALLSVEARHETVTARTIKKCIRHGKGVLASADRDAVAFDRIVRAVYSEAHSWKGLLRFREVQDGYWYAPFAPKHDVIELLTAHFARRLNGEHFVIHDCPRGCAVLYEDGRTEYFSATALSVVETADESAYQDAWRLFYKTGAIPERANPKLRQSNMPKRYWAHLIERL